MASTSENSGNNQKQYAGLDKDLSFGHAQCCFAVGPLFLTPAH